MGEVAFLGRSNVGKSSLINSLLSRKNLAQTSNTPGKTRLMNFYQVQTNQLPEPFHLVDLPGYGYAKVSKAEQNAWRKHFQVYLRKREGLKGAIQLIDGRHPPQANDLQMFEWLGDNEIPQMVVLTKMDKLKQNDLKKAHQRAIDILKVDPSHVLPTSAQTNKGRDELWSVINAILTSY